MIQSYNEKGCLKMAAFFMSSNSVFVAFKKINIYQRTTLCQQHRRQLKQRQQYSWRH